jgi:hypothetical protein
MPNADNTQYMMPDAIVGMGVFCVLNPKFLTPFDLQSHNLALATAAAVVL